MKTAFSICAMLLVALACAPEEFTLNLNVSRRSALGGGGGHGAGDGSDSTAVIPPPAGDTSVLVSAVEFPDDYDWQRDTAFGQVSGKILLLRGGVRILEIPAGAGGKASLDPDMHHLVGGHLYTEYSDGASTYVSRDGEKLFTFEGREYLRGILPMDGHLYTLSQRRDGKGFLLRQDGEVLLDKDAGIVLKSFRDYPDRESGALYENEGKVCFHYSKGIGSERVWYSVQNLVESQIYLYDEELLDARFFGDELCVVSTAAGRGLKMTIGKRQNIIQKAANPKLKGISLIKNGQEILAIGGIAFLQADRNPPQTCIWSYSGIKASAEGEYRFVLDKESNVYMYGSDGDSGTAILNGRCERVSSIGGMTPYSRRVAAMHGSQMYLALSPADSSSATVIWSKGKTTLMRLNGFLTDIDIQSE